MRSQLYDFPLTVNTSIDNEIKNIKGQKGGMNLYNLIGGSGGLTNADKDMLINYSSAVDYAGNEGTQQGQYISTQELLSFPDRSLITLGGCASGCKRCYDIGPSKCVECLDGYKLNFGNCRKVTGNYLKIPVKNYNNKFISLNTVNLKDNFYLTTETQFTITVWIKYFGQLDTSSTACFTLFRFKKDGSRYICFNSSEGKLYFYEGTNIIYQETAVFQSFIGQWCLISISNFINIDPVVKDLQNYQTSLAKFYVHDTEVKKQGPEIASPGWKFDAIDIGYEFTALISDLRVYRNFILNPYAYVTGNKRSLYIMINYPLDGKSSTTDCVTDQILDLTVYSDLTLDQLINTYSKKLGIECKPDYNPYLSGSCSAGTFFNYTDLTNKEVPCSTCDGGCLDNCAGLGKNKCQCDFASGNQILRYDTNTTSHYCDVLPYLDFSKSDALNLSPVKASNTGEYTLELWFNLYSYKDNYIAFDSEEIIWDQHLAFKIFNNNNTLGISCNPVYKMGAESDYTKYYKDEFLGKGIKTWIYISCSVSLPDRKFFTNKGVTYPIETPTNLFPDSKSLTTTSLTIRTGNNGRINYGYLFIKDIRLWSVAGFNYQNTDCYPPVGFSFTKSLLHYFRNEDGKTIMEDIITGISGSGSKRPDFIGYNVVDVPREKMVASKFDICKKLFFEFEKSFKFFM